ncbi:MAG: hypothetical protein KJ712_11100 [Bacteroidetes bacterium]|nr:hypothetical protein [Bacteroidota bacterium]MBU1484146.1 hypothetical protein [Bacteroidota bacterium]MBU2047266.1 hypothetical protein [Bacteroidota bacterium]MBU2375972.1 hypothetical protein [Bacteroidota bacterium]
MEKFFYILIPIAFFLYNAYNNYIKEQQKSRSRSLKQPEQNSSEVFPDDFVGGKIKKDYTEGHFQSTSFLDDKKKELQMRREEVRKKQKAAKEAVNDFYNLEEPVEEVLKGREIHAKHHHEFKFPEQEQEAKRIFDLREAVIQQAIINRPDY